jgi:hypothetical protein
MTHDDDNREKDDIAATIDSLFDEIIADGWCWEHQAYHQPRDHAVGCIFCNRKTWHPHAVCDVHQVTRLGG